MAVQAIIQVTSPGQWCIIIQLVHDIAEQDDHLFPAMLTGKGTVDVIEHGLMEQKLDTCCLQLQKPIKT